MANGIGGTQQHLSRTAALLASLSSSSSSSSSWGPSSPSSDAGRWREMMRGAAVVCSSLSSSCLCTQHPSQHWIQDSTERCSKVQCSACAAQGWLPPILMYVAEFRYRPLGTGATREKVVVLSTITIDLCQCAELARRWCRYYLSKPSEAGVI